MKTKGLIYAALGVAGVLSLCVGGFFYIRSAVNPTRIAGMASRRLSRELDRKVSIGKAGLSLGLFHLSVVVDSLRVAGQEPDDPPLLTAQRAGLRLRLLPLLFGKVSVGKLELDEPEITLLSRQDTGKASRRPHKKPGGQLPMALEMGGLIVKKGSFTVLSPQRDTTLALRDVDMSLSASASRDLRVRIRSRGKARAVVLAPGIGNKALSWDISGFYDPGADSLRLENSRFSVERMGVIFSLSGRDLSGDSALWSLFLPSQELDLGEALRASGEEGLSLSGDLRVEGLGIVLRKKGASLGLSEIRGSVDAGGLELWAGSGPVKFSKLRGDFRGDRVMFELAASSNRTRAFLEGTVVFLPGLAYFVNGEGSLFLEDFSPGAAGRVRFRFRSEGSPERPRLKARITARGLKTENMPEKIDRAEVALNYSPDSTVLELVEVKGKSLAFSASGVMYPKQKRGNFSVHASRIDLDAFLPQGGGAGAGSKDFTPDAIPMGTLEFSADRITLRGEELRDVRLKVVSDPRGLRADYFRALLYGGRLTGSGSISHARPQTVEFDMSLSNFDLAAFCQKHDPVGAKLTGAASFSVSGNFIADDPFSTMNLSGRISSPGGQIRGSKTMARLADFTGVASLRSFSFTGTGTEFTVKDGWVNCRRLVLPGDGVGLSFTGRASFRHELDMDIAVDVDLTRVQGLSRRLSELLIPSARSATFYLKLGGTLEDPEIKIVSADAGMAEEAGERARQEYEKGKKRAQEEVEKGKEKIKKEVEQEKERIKKKAQEEKEKWKKKFGF